MTPSALIFTTSSGKHIYPHNDERDKATAVNFQAFRRTFGTWMQKTGATVKAVQGAMRHSTPDQTLKARKFNLSTKNTPVGG